MSDDTPIPGTSGNGAVAAVAGFVDTGPIRKSITESMSGENPTVSAHDIAKALWDLSPGGGDGDGGGVPPEDHKKQIKRHNTLAVLLAVFLGPGGALAVIYATSDRSKINEVNIESTMKKMDETIEPRLDKTEGDIRYIKAEIKDFGEDVDKAMEQQDVIIEGIEDLKKENVKRLQDELRDARRELRRRPRRAP